MFQSLTERKQYAEMCRAVEGTCAVVRWLEEVPLWRRPPVIVHIRWINKVTVSYSLLVIVWIENDLIKLHCQFRTQTPIRFHHDVKISNLRIWSVSVLSNLRCIKNRRIGSPIIVYLVPLLKRRAGHTFDR